MSRKTIVYLYKRKYPKIESSLEVLSSRFVCQSLQVTPSRAFAFSVSKVPALIVFDKHGEVRVTHQGLESIINYLEILNEEK